MPGSEANASVGHRRWLTKLSKQESCTGKAAANPRSHAGFKLAEPRSVASWPKRNPDLARLTQPCRKDTLSCCLQDPTRRGQRAKPVRRNALDPKLRCCLQDC